MVTEMLRSPVLRLRKATFGLVWLDPCGRPAVKIAADLEIPV